MAFTKGHNPHHPEAGSSTKVEPIRTKRAIERIKQFLESKPRDYCLFGRWPRLYRKWAKSLKAFLYIAFRPQFLVF